MEATSSYQSYLNSMKNYEVPQGRIDYQAPFSESFEVIYNRAKEQDINLSSAKNFLETLSSAELQILQKYTGLVDAVNIDTISSEGAFNLLLHDNEQYDFNGDGLAEVGIGKHILAVPPNMPVDVRDAYISAMNSISDKDKLMALSLTLDPAHLKSVIYNEPYTPTNMDYNYLKTAVENMLNPKGGGFTSEETKASIRAFWDSFESVYTGDKTQNNEERSSELTQFLNDLRTKGAAQFLADLNQEKIDALVEEFKQKLMKEMGDSPEALDEIARLVEDYRKQLIDDMQDKTELEKRRKEGKITPLSSDTSVQKLLDLQQESAVSGLEKLLK